MEPPDTARMKRKEYEQIRKGLHVELTKVQQRVQATGAKIRILFEGRDGAGKGGSIRAITERVSPRVFRVIALPNREVDPATAQGTQPMRMIQELC